VEVDADQLRRGCLAPHPLLVGDERLLLAHDGHQAATAGPINDLAVGAPGWQTPSPGAKWPSCFRLTINVEPFLASPSGMATAGALITLVKVYYDVGNSTDKGRDVTKEIRTLGKLICEFHAKDGEYMLGQGRIDFKKVRQAIDDAGYSGWIQIEAAQPHGLIPDYTADRKYLKGIFPARL
jgi:hypothetical protein